MAVVKPHKPYNYFYFSQMAKISETGIDTNILKAHSTRSAATSAAAAAGVTTTDILKAADW